MPKDVDIPNPIHREAAGVFERRDFPIGEVIAATEKFSQPHLLETKTENVASAPFRAETNPIRGRSSGLFPWRRFSGCGSGRSVTSTVSSLVAVRAEGAHVAGASVPPSLTGWTWSTSVAGAPQSWQWWPSRVSTTARRWRQRRVDPFRGLCWGQYDPLVAGDTSGTVSAGLTTFEGVRR